MMIDSYIKIHEWRLLGVKTDVQGSGYLARTGWTIYVDMNYVRTELVRRFIAVP